MIRIKVYCSMCEMPKKQPLEFAVTSAKDLDPEVLKRAIEQKGWIVQFNGDNMDTYCTKKCAE